MRFGALLVILMVVIVGGGALWLRSISQVSPLPTLLPLANPSPSPVMPNIEPREEAVIVTLKTSKGDIVVELDGAAAPLTVGNFVKLARDNFYDGVTFHRVIPGFMIQGGDPLSKDQTQRSAHGTGGPGYTFPDEINERKLVRGSVAMANAGPNTNGSQFFIVTASATPHLDGKHTNFGTVTSGMEVVDAIEAVQRDQNDNPLVPVVINDISIQE